VGLLPVNGSLRATNGLFSPAAGSLSWRIALRPARIVYFLEIRSRLRSKFALFNSLQPIDLNEVFTGYGLFFFQPAVFFAGVPF
jgi:hypothetical protein